MTEATTTVDTSGVTRTADGTIASPDTSTTTTTQETTATKEGSSLLNQQTETKPEAKPETKEEPKGAPEKYEDYKLPDGYALDAEVRKEVDGLFKGMNLSQAQAQSLVDFYVKQTTDAFKAPFDAYQTMTNEWREAAMNHPDLRGKLGPGQEVNVRIAKALDGIGDTKLASDFRELMDMTGAGNHPAFIRVLDHFARRLSEGTHVAGNGPSKAGQSEPGKAPASAAAAIWPNLPSASR